MGWEDSLQAGIGGLAEAEGAMGGNLQQWAEGRATRQAAELRGAGPGPRRQGRGFRARGGPPPNGRSGGPGGGPLTGPRNGPPGDGGQGGLSGSYRAAQARQAARRTARRLRHRSRHGIWPWLALTAALVTSLSLHAHRPVLLAIVAVWLPPSLWWWYKHRVRHVHSQPIPEPVPEPERDDLLEDLREHVCGKGGPLAGAQVSEMPPVPGGRRFMFDLIRGRQHTGTVTAVRAGIASGGGVSLSRVLAEPMPSDIPGERGPEHKAMVTILNERHPQQAIQEFTGPTLVSATGLFDVGPYGDSEMAKARLYKVDEHGRAIRAATGITAGSPGSGKSRYAERKILEHLASGLFQVILLDGQSGASIPTLAEHVGWAALPRSEWGICLRAVIRLMIARTKLIAAKKIPHWDPELGPFVQVFLEEAHRPLGIAANLLAVKFGVQESEKVGIGWDISTQFPSQVELGATSGAAGANVLRDLASGGNVTLFRTGGPFATSVLVGNVEVDPRELPQRAGMCHPLGVSMRTAPARNIRAADPVAWATQYTAAPFSALDIAALDGADGAWSGRLERLAAHTTVPDAASLDIGDLDAEAGALLGEKGTTPPTSAQQQQKATASVLVWEILGDSGPLKRADLIDEVRIRSGHDYNPSAIDQALAALENHGGVRKTPGEFGVWERVAALSVVKEG